MTEVVDVAIVGAGPYGLSLAAHLRAAGVSYRQFGQPMHLWRDQMPRGMYLKSQGFASNLSDPAGTHTLAEFCRQTGRPYADYGLPVPLDVFIAYGLWFAAEQTDGAEQSNVTRLAGRDGYFELTLADGSTAAARQVVLAAGVEHFAYLPPELAGLDGVSHSSQATEPATYAGQRVAVIGRGQSALESAALLHEHGADVEVITRSADIAWNGVPLLPDRPLWQRLREPEAGLGSGWGTWFYSRQPGIFRHLPEQNRIHRARTALGPAGASWLRERVEGQIPVRTSQRLYRVESRRDGMAITMTSRDGSTSQIHADQVIAATGYRPSLRRLAFLDDSLRSRMRSVAGTAQVDGGYQSSVPGLFVIGPAVAPVFGPVMRFVYGSDHAARTVARRLSTGGRTARQSPARPLAGVAAR